MIVNYIYNLRRRQHTLHTTLPQTKKTESILGAHLGLLFTTIIWASTFINIKFVLEQVPANTLAFLRFFMASIVLVIYFFYFHKPFIKVKDLGWVVLCSLTGVTLYNILQNQGLKYAGATDAAILASLAPVFMAIFARIFLKEHLSFQQIIGIVIAFAGTVLVTTNGSLHNIANLNHIRLWGDFLVGITGLSWAAYNIVLKKLLCRYPAETVLTYTTVGGTIFLFPPAFYEAPNLANINLWGWFNIFYLGLLASALAYFLWNKALTKVPTITAGAYLYFLPVLAALIAFLFLHEIPTVYTITGGIITLIGTYFAGR